MRIKDCIKGFNQGISKVISPEQTFKVVLRKIQNIDPPILKGYYEIQRPSRIPQYRFIGADYYQQIVQSEGTNGKGHFNEQALASGLMELVERYSCYKYLRNRNIPKISSFKDLRDNVFQLEDLYSNFIDGASVRILKDKEVKTAKIRWYKGYSLNGGKVYLPMSIIGFLLEGGNGMAAGNSLEEALLHAICEVIERHCLSLIDVNKLRTPLIDLSTVKSSTAKKLIKKFQSLKHSIIIKDFSLGIGLPVIGVVRKIDKANCMITAGVATNREEALIRALTENSQCESNQNYTRVYLAEHYFVKNKIISMKDILNVDNKNMRLELEKIEEILNKKNMKAFFINTTDKTLNIPSVIVYITRAKYFVKKIAFQNILIGLIEESLATENYNDAERYLNKANKIDKRNQLIYFYFWGLLLKSRFQYRKAIQYFLKTADIEIAELQNFIFVTLGLCYQAINDMDNAIDYYIKTIDLFPNFRFERLKSYYDNISLRSKDRKFFNNAKILYHEIRLIRNYFSKIGLQKFKKIFYKYKQNKKATLTCLEKARAYFNSKQYKEAIREANKAIKLNHIAGKVYNIHFILGLCYEKIKQYKKAIRELKKAEKINSQEPQIFFSLSSCYRGINQTEQAEKELSRGTILLSSKNPLKASQPSI